MSRTRGLRILGVLVALVLGMPSHASAQQTRDEERAAAQAAKAGNLHPYQPTGPERWVERASQVLLGAPTTFYPYVGSVYPGGWMAIGPAYRARYGDSGVFAAHAAWSLRNYLGAEAVLTLPTLGAGRVKPSLNANWMRAPTVAFYGIGMDSVSENKGSFLYRDTTAGASVRYELARHVAIGGGLDYIDAETEPATIATAFTPVEVAGLGSEVSYVRSRAFTEVDWRESPGYSTSGGLYRVDWSGSAAQRGAPYSFTRLDAEATQLIPVLRANWVIALRALASVTDTQDGDSVPYFLLPALGGSRNLRGYSSWRFRDQHRILVSGEYRWTAGQFVDMALFFDAGKVVALRRDLDLTDLNTSYGIGVRFHAPAATFLRIELARTRDDGMGLIFSFGPSF